MPHFGRSSMLTKVAIFRSICLSIGRFLVTLGCPFCSLDHGLVTAMVIAAWFILTLVVLNDKSICHRICLVGVNDLRWSF